MLVPNQKGLHRSCTSSVALQLGCFSTFPGLWIGPDKAMLDMQVQQGCFLFLFLFLGGGLDAAEVLSG